MIQKGVLGALDIFRETTSTTTTTTTTTQPPGGCVLSVQGYGAQVTGGAGQITIHVTTLNASGAGSLDSAMGSNRIIVFDVGGTISNFRGNYSGLTNFTIDGTTAPSPGITLTNNSNGDCFSLEQSSNFIITNIRARGVGNGAGNDAMAFNNNCHDFVIDHVSVSGGQDGNLDVTESYNATVQYCIIGGGGNNGTSDKWSGAMLIAYNPTKNVSIHHNLFSAVTTAGVGERIPLISHITGSIVTADFRNNLVWRWGRNGGTGSGYATGVSDGANANVVNNYYYSTSAQTSATVNQADPSLPIGHMYAATNLSGNAINANAGNNNAQFAITAFAQIPVESPCSSASCVLANAGCFPRDATDTAYINAVTLFGC